MLISTALLVDSIIRNSVCTPAKLPCRRVDGQLLKALTRYSRSCFKQFRLLLIAFINKLVY
jgi:hypothetical protein